MHTVKASDVISNVGPLMFLTNMYDQDLTAIPIRYVCTWSLTIILDALGLERIGYASIKMERWNSSIKGSESLRVRLYLNNITFLQGQLLAHKPETDEPDLTWTLVVAPEAAGPPSVPRIIVHVMCI